MKKEKKAEKKKKQPFNLRWTLSNIQLNKN